MTKKAITLQTTVNAEGKVEFALPLAPGTPVEIVVLAPEEETLNDLVQASVSSTSFWDNPMDDEDWNDA
jgi:hypothetical protein